MNKNSILLFHYIYLPYISFGINVIYPKEGVSYILFIGCQFSLLSQSNYCHENQPVILIVIGSEIN